MFGRTGITLNWIVSYPTDRYQQVQLKDSLSPEICLQFEIPLGSVLDLLLFTLYTTSLSTIFQGHHIVHHRYADDSQLYSPSRLRTLQKCIDLVRNWMLLSKLKHEPSKTDFLLIAHEHQHTKDLSLLPMPLAWERVQQAKSARNLSVIFHQNLTLGFRFLRSVGHVFTASRICVASRNTLAWVSKLSASSLHRESVGLLQLSFL